MTTADTIGEILSQFVIRINRVIDHRMGTTAFQDREPEFIEASELAGDIIADKIELTPERLLMFKVGALYATTLSEARRQQAANQHTVQDSNTIPLAEE